MKKLKNRHKAYLWFSKKNARKGKFFFVPTGEGKKLAVCTEITMDKEPPDSTSFFLSTTYLPKNRKVIKCNGEPR